MKPESVEPEDVLGIEVPARLAGSTTARQATPSTGALARKAGRHRGPMAGCVGEDCKEAAAGVMSVNPKRAIQRIVPMMEWMRPGRPSAPLCASAQPMLAMRLHRQRFD
ncbi:hypothetical protein ASF73_09330 [Xanthomonas sp. Leaf131]|nr:hypothetical protein ASF73_09330 [Xanthomonas sp. Leaf131]